MLTISARGRAGIRNAAQVATGATMRAVVKRRARGVGQEARLRRPSPGAGEGGSQQVRNEEMRARGLDPENVRGAYEQVKRMAGDGGEAAGGTLSARSGTRREHPDSAGRDEKRSQGTPQGSPCTPLTQRKHLFDGKEMTDGNFFRGCIHHDFFDQKTKNLLTFSKT